MAKTSTSSQETTEKKKTPQVKIEQQEHHTSEEAIEADETTPTETTIVKEENSLKGKGQGSGASKRRSPANKSSSKGKSRVSVKLEDGDESSNDIVSAIVSSIKKAGQKKSEFQRTEGKRFLKSFASKFGAFKLSLEESTFILNEMWDLSHSESRDSSKTNRNTKHSNEDTVDDEYLDETGSVKIKRKSRKVEEKDKDAPKKPRTCFILFSTAKRDERVKDGSYDILPEGVPKKDAFKVNAKIMGKLWAEIFDKDTKTIKNEEEYKFWQDKAQEDKERYHAEMEEYKKKKDLALSNAEGIEKIVEEKPKVKSEKKSTTETKTQALSITKGSSTPASKKPSSSVSPTMKKVETPVAPKRREPAKKTVPSVNQKGIKAPQNQPLKLPQYTSKEDSTQEDEDLMDEEGRDFPTSDAE